MNCIYSLPCFPSDSNNILNKFSCLLSTWFQYLYINSKNSKFHLNALKESVNICIRVLSEILQFFTHLSLETVFQALTLTQICCVNMNIFF